MNVVQPDIAHCLPAALGTYLLDYTWHDLEQSVVRTPVLAWAITESGFAKPLTMFGMRPPDAYPPIILHPDGSVEQIEGMFLTFSRWIEELHWEKKQELSDTLAVN